MNTGNNRELLAEDIEEVDINKSGILLISDIVSNLPGKVEVKDVKKIIRISRDPGDTKHYYYTETTNVEYKITPTISINQFNQDSFSKSLKQRIRKIISRIKG